LKIARIAEESFNLIRFAYGSYFPLLDCRYLEESTGNRGGQRGGGQAFQGSAYYHDRIDDFVKPLTEIVRRQTVSDIENRIRNAVNVFGVQTSIHYPEVRLILLVAALEALLLTKSDRDYLGWKLAERTCFLLGKSKKQRMRIYDFITDVYNKRSEFAHQKTNRKKEVTEGDLLKLENLVTLTVFELLMLKSRGYQQIEKHKEVPNIVNYLDELKFSKYQRKRNTLSLPKE